MSDTTRAIWLMIGAMAGFAVGDLMIKLAGVRLPIGQIIVILAGGGLVLFAILARVQRQALMSRGFLARPMIIRNLAEAASVVLFVSGLAVTPLNAFAAITQVTPIVVTLGAILFLGQTVGWRRWLAIGMGFAGVLVIIRPGTADFEIGALLALAAATTMAIRDLATRAAPEQVGSVQMAVWGNLSMLVAGLVLLVIGGGPVAMTGREVLIMAVAVIVGSAAYFAITAAMRKGDVAAIVPYRYSRLVFALILSILFLGERPDSMTLAGAAIVVSAGLYTLIREARMQARR